MRYVKRKDLYFMIQRLILITHDDLYDWYFEGLCTVRFFNNMSSGKTYKRASEMELDIADWRSKDQIMNMILDVQSTEKLIQSLFMYDFPKEIFPLVKSSGENFEIADRFVLSVWTRELVNVYSELMILMSQNKLLIKVINEKMTKRYIEWMKISLKKIFRLWNVVNWRFRYYWR